MNFKFQISNFKNGLRAFGALAAMGIMGLMAHAANPTFNSFNQTQFNTAGNQVSMTNPPFTNSGQLYFDFTNGNDANIGVNPWQAKQNTYLSSGASGLLSGQTANLSAGTYAPSVGATITYCSNTVLNAWGAVLNLNKNGVQIQFDGSNVVNGGTYVDVRAGTGTHFPITLDDAVNTLVTLNNVTAIGKTDGIFYKVNSTNGSANLIMNGGSIFSQWDCAVNINTIPTVSTNQTNFMYFKGVNFESQGVNAIYNYPAALSGVQCFHAQGVNSTNTFVGCSFTMHGDFTNAGATGLTFDGKDSGGTSYSVVGYISGCTFNITNTNGPTYWVRATNGATVYIDGPRWQPGLYTNDATSTIIFRGDTSGGITNGSAVPAGCIGEIISSFVSSNNAVTITNNVITNVTSIALTPGDWDVQGNFNVYATTTTVTIPSVAAITTNSATIPADGSEVYSQDLVTAAVLNDTMTLPRKQVLTTSNLTVYLDGLVHTGTSTVHAFGGITARRVR